VVAALPLRLFLGNDVVPLSPTLIQGFPRGPSASLGQSDPRVLHDLAFVKADPRESPVRGSVDSLPEFLFPVK